MEIVKVIGIGFIAACAALVLRQHRPEMALQVGLAAGILIFFIIIFKLSAVVDLLSSFADRAGVEPRFMGIILKVTGIAYLSEFAAGTCKDAGESAIASKIEMAGKVMIMVMAVPIVGALLDVLLNLIP